LPQRRTALKRLRVDKTKRLHNIKLKTELKNSIKKFLSLVSAKKTKEAQDFFSTIISKLDRAAAKGIIHKNTAARKKSQFTRRIKGIA